MLDYHQNHFELFELAPRFAIDLAQLDLRYRKLQSEVHPDRHAAASAAEKLRSMQLSTLINEAYQTLKSPIGRARYLLHLQGVDTQEETNTAMPPAFLMQQMEWREAIEEAREANDLDALDKLLRELRSESRALEQTLHHTLDEHPDYGQAAESVRKLRFLDKVRDEVEHAIEALEETL
jgi:molecular chaperone HscB